eukprot:COSAG06_NODE_2865_length_6157_cov_30.730769_9_plen_71_part_00
MGIVADTYVCVCCAVSSCVFVRSFGWLYWGMLYYHSIGAAAVQENGLFVLTILASNQGSNLEHNINLGRS